MGFADRLLNYRTDVIEVAEFLKVVVALIFTLPVISLQDLTLHG